MSEEISIPEVVRNLQRLNDQIEKLSDKIGELQKSVLAEADLRFNQRAEILRLDLESQIKALDSKYEPVKRVVYGFVSVVLVTVAGAILALVVHK
jgi:archaellum component FlaC